MLIGAGEEGNEAGGAGIRAGSGSGGGPADADFTLGTGGGGDGEETRGGSLPRRDCDW